MELLESVLSHVSLFAQLRPDEIGHVAGRFSLTRMTKGEERSFAASTTEARLVVVIEGEVDLVVETAAAALRSHLEAGDRAGEVALLTGKRYPWKLTATEPSTIATLDSPGFEALLAKYPALALPLASELASELGTMNDLLRQLVEVHAEDLSPDQLAAAVDERRRAIARRGARVTRLSIGALFRRLVIERGAEPPFWMLTGFIVSLGLARMVVALILKYGLEKQLFALVPGNDPNPMHVHHFNYGLILVGAAGLAALFPFGRRALRGLAFAFGFGCGLVFDEFALFWNLNPEYAQSLSLLAAAVMVAVLVQLTYFRGYWARLGRRAWFSLRGAR
jgi:CRP-like cAMP-binding protein